MTGVVSVEWCQWCRSHVTAPHSCPYAAPSCPTPEGHPCGCCLVCLAAQAADPRYARPTEEETTHDRPSV